MAEPTISGTLTREDKDRIGFANAIVLSSGDEDELPANGGAGSSSFHGAGSSSDPAAKRVKLEGGGSKPLPAPAAPAPAAPTNQPKPNGSDLFSDTSFSDPPPLTKHPARLAGHVVLKLHALKGHVGTHYQFNAVTRRMEWVATPAPQWLHVGAHISPYAQPNHQLQAIRTASIRGDLRIDDGTRGGELFSALCRLAEPANNNLHRPLIRVECNPPLPWALQRDGDGGPPLLARLDVWFEPLIFSFKISAWRNPESFYHDVWQIMEGLVPVRPPIPTPRPPPVLGSSEFALSGGGEEARRTHGQAGRVDAFAFTTAGLMRAMESAGYPEMSDPPGLQLTLYSYQRQTLQWMHDRETQSGGLNALFWEERPSHLGQVTDPYDGSSEQADHTFFYNSMAGELLDAPPPIVSGGFLCEEMGLGKTVEMCALVLANPYSAAAVAAGRAKLVPKLTWQQRSNGVDPQTLAPPETPATLVVCPVTLLTQWRKEAAKCCGQQMSVYVFHGDGRPQSRESLLEEMGDAAIVLTTYDMLKPTGQRPTALKALHWWRVVLDESQMVPKPPAEAGLSALSVIARSLADLSRTHSWLMSGTPTGNSVDDLLGQLMFLGVDPYADRGQNGDAFWEREVSSRWKARDVDALEVVHDLLGQIMMRHSKGQCKKNSQDAIVTMPPKVETVVMVPLADASETFLYGCLERFTAKEMGKTNGSCACLNRGALGFECSCLPRRRDLVLSTRDLQLVATHAATLDLDALEAKLHAESERQRVAAEQKQKQAAAAAAGGGGGGGGKSKAKATAKAKAGGDAGGSSSADGAGSSAPAADASGRRLLRDVAQEWIAAGDARAARAKSLLEATNAPRCILCQAPFAMTASAASAEVSVLATKPILTGCSHLFCETCLTDALAAPGAPDACPECRHPAPMHDPMRLLTPLDAPSEAAARAANNPSASRQPRDGPGASSSEDDASAANGDGALSRRIETCAWSAKALASADRLKELRVWRCSGAPCKQGSAEQPVSVDLEHGKSEVHFCTAGCAEAMLRACMSKQASGAYLVGAGWPGKAMRGQSYKTIASAVTTLREAIGKATPAGPGGKPQSTWRGVPLYGAPSYPHRPSQSRLRVDSNKPHLSSFPPDAKDGAFLAHFDAAGGKRDYGLHYPFAIGSKLRAVLSEIQRIRRGEADEDAIEQDEEGEEEDKGGGAGPRVMTTAGGQSRGSSTDAAPPPPLPPTLPPAAAPPPVAPLVGTALVGRRLRVWWPSDERWFHGAVTSYTSRRGHFLVYDHVAGEEECHRWEALEDETWELEQGGELESAPAGQPPAGALPAGAQPAPPPPAAAASTPPAAARGTPRASASRGKAKAAPEAASAEAPSASSRGKGKAKAVEPAAASTAEQIKAARAKQSAARATAHAKARAAVAAAKAKGLPAKVVVFCGSASGRSQLSGLPLPSPLDVLSEALTHEVGAGCWARIEGDYTHDQRVASLTRFESDDDCTVLLLPVRACSSGLTLTCANHVLLVDLQADHRAELQLINRVWRIGQDKPVFVKRFVAQGTVEERMLELRKMTKGVLAEEKNALAMAAPAGSSEAAPSSGKQKAPPGADAQAAAERLEDVRYLLGLKGGGRAAVQ